MDDMRKMVAWEMGDAEIDLADGDKVELPVLRCFVVNRDQMAAITKPTTLDLVLPNVESVMILRRTIDEYLGVKGR